MKLAKTFKTGFIKQTEVKKTFYLLARIFVMDERIARFRAHQKSIERYQRLLKTELTKVEMHYLEKLLSEERFVMAILSAGHQRSIDLPDALQ
jgi:hypothetical protein